MKINHQQIKIGELPGLNITMPSLLIGAGQPKVTIISGIHGGEESGALIMKKLLDALEPLELKGTLQLLPSGNPLAQGAKTRVTPGYDYANLNREFPGKELGGLTAQAAKIITDLVKDSIGVLDLHTFTMLCPLIGILTSTPDQDKNAEVLKVLQIMEPDLIWRLDIKKGEDVKFKGTLGDALALTKVNYLCLETPNIYRITPAVVDRAVEAIKKMLVYYGVLAGPALAPAKNIPLVSRTDLNSRGAGLFIPGKEVMSKVKAGEVVGHLYSLQNYQPVPITSPLAGLVMMIRDNSLVSTGDKLVSLGMDVS